jgi:predicted naringenin-chalcone synthase
LDMFHLSTYFAADPCKRALKSSFDIYPVHRFVYLSFAVASVVAVPVFVDAVAAAVVAWQASRKQSTHLKLLVFVLGNSVAGL